MARAALAWDREEMEAITVVIGAAVILSIPAEEVERRLKIWSGADDVRIRRKVFLKNFVCNAFYN